MLCRSCGHEVGGSSSLCERCGAPVEGAARPAPPDATLGFSGQETRLGGAPVSAPALAPGALFHDRYEIFELVGQGGMGVVYRARDRLAGKDVCLKVIRPELVSSGAVAQRFLREGLLARDLRHPSIVSVYDVATANGVYYLTMEYLEGLTLRRWMLQARGRRREVPLPVAVGILQQVLQGVKAAHEAGVVHRDLKPENVMLLGEPFQGDHRLRILDFGLARALDTGLQLTAQGAAMGTPAYMAPEQETGAETVGPEADIYSVGVMFYELLCEVLPRGRWELPGELRPDLPPWVDELVGSALKAHPRRRLESAASFLEALERRERRGEAPARPSPAAGAAGGPSPPPRPEAPALGSPAVEARTWVFWSWVPGLAFVTWIHVTARTRNPFHLVWAGLYFVALMVVGTFEDEATGDPLDSQGLLCLALYVGGLVHAYTTRQAVADEIARLRPRR